jgi:hypothetical protein
MPGVHCGSKGCGIGGPTESPTPKPPPGGKQKCSPNSPGRTSNGDCIPPPSTNRRAHGTQLAPDYTAHDRAKALAHPTRSLAKLAAGKSLGLAFVKRAQEAKRDAGQPVTVPAGQNPDLYRADVAQRNAKATAHTARFTARLQGKVDRHAAVIARRTARNADTSHLA